MDDRLVLPIVRTAHDSLSGCVVTVSAVITIPSGGSFEIVSYRMAGALATELVHPRRRISDVHLA
jgi:hypothetical protein